MAKTKPPVFTVKNSQDSTRQKPLVVVDVQPGTYEAATLIEAIEAAGKARPTASHSEDVSAYVALDPVDADTPKPAALAANDAAGLKTPA